MGGSGKYQIECACCGRHGTHGGRGLLRECRSRIATAEGPEGLARYPLVRPGRRSDRLEQWERLARTSGPDVSMRVIAERIGISERQLLRLLKDARAAGDPRAIPSPWVRAYRRQQPSHRKVTP